MPLDPLVANELAEMLTTIPDFPRFKSAIDATAVDLTELCEDEERARWLVKELRKSWEVWAGTHAMIEFYRANWNPRPVLPPPNAAVDWVKPPIECRKCQDSGVVKLADGYHWCVCEQASLIRQETPEWLTLLNKPLQRGPQIVKPPDTPPLPAAEVLRCGRCNGTGYAGTDFCECQMGRDLRLSLRSA